MLVYYFTPKVQAPFGVSLLQPLLIIQGYNQNKMYCELMLTYDTPALRQTGSMVFIHIEHICTFFVTFFSATIDGRNVIFGHKLHIGTLYRGKRFWTHPIPTSCLPIPKTLPTIWGTYMKLMTKYQISAIKVAEKNATKNGHIQNVCSMCIKINKVGKQEVGI
jgi:hypothetical protein